MALDLNATLDALGVRLATIAGLRVYDYPPDQVAAPAGVVGYPDEITYDETMARGTDYTTITVTVLVTSGSDRATRKALAPYQSGTGASSVKAAIDGTLGGAVKDARVASSVTRGVNVGGIDYDAAVFTVEVYA